MRPKKIDGGGISARWPRLATSRATYLPEGVYTHERHYQLPTVRHPLFHAPSDEVLRGLRAEGFTWHAPTFSWIRPEGWNGLPEDFCDWLVANADPAPVELEPAPANF